MKIEHLSLCVIINALVMILLAAYFFIGPFFILLHDLRDPALSSNSMPEFSYRWHRQLSPDIEDWALERVAIGRAAQLGIDDISGTEWPMFSAVFYLWATEALQKAWEENHALSAVMPKDYAHGAIAAAAALVSDPNNATWVRKHWGDNYLHKENIFYRMLLISGLTSYQQLSGDDRYEPLLRDQVLSLATELDESGSGLLDDYPGQCYPVDVLPAISAIRRADAVLGSDHSGMVSRAIRGFEGDALDPQTQLPSYIASSITGQGYGPARGVGISYMLIWAAELWPETATRWYASFDTHFWQHGRLTAGFREYAATKKSRDWSVDVDAGPVVAGYGTAASAFGIGAARTHGRFDHAYPLGAQALVTAWPLPDGTLLNARLLSNLSDAPFVGEAALLFSFTRRPAAGSHVVESQGLPWLVNILLFSYLSVGVLVVVPALVSVRRWRSKGLAMDSFRAPRSQFGVWCALVIIGTVVAALTSPGYGIILLMLAQFLPRSGRHRATTRDIGESS